MPFLHFVFVVLALTNLCSAQNATASPSSQPSVSPTVFFTTMPPTTPQVPIGGQLNGTIGTASALTFNLNLFQNYPSVTLSTCSPNTNLFNVTMEVLDDTGAEVAFDTGSCPGDARQAQITLTNPPAGNYTVVLGQLGLANPSDLWSLSVDATTFAPTSSPTASGSDSDSDSDSASGSGSDSDDSGSASGSGSDSDDASILSAFSFGSNHDAVHKESNANGDEQYEMQMGLSDATWLNIWLVAGVCAVVNFLGFCMCKRNEVLKTESDY